MSESNHSRTAQQHWHGPNQEGYWVPRFLSLANASTNQKLWWVMGHLYQSNPERIVWFVISRLYLWEWRMVRSRAAFLELEMLIWRGLLNVEERMVTNPVNNIIFFLMVRMHTCPLVVELMGTCQTIVCLCRPPSKLEIDHTFNGATFVVIESTDLESALFRHEISSGSWHYFTARTFKCVPYSKRSKVLISSLIQE